MLDSFNDPPPEYRVHALWIWNSRIEPEEAERQIREMRNQGFGGLVIEHGPDLQALHSDDELMCCLQRVARTAQGLGMRAYLHDPRHNFTPPEGQVWSKFLYLLGQRDHDEALNPTARRNLQVLAEYAENFWKAPIEEIKGAVDWQMSLGGFTMLAPRLPFTVEGPDQYGPRRFYGAASWPYQRLLADYAGRLSYALSQGKGSAQVALLETTTHNGRIAGPLAARYMDMYCRTMLREHIGFDIITEDALGNATCIDQKIHIGGAAYEALIMPPITNIRPRAARVVRDFAEEGGALVGTGLLPYSGTQGTTQPWIRKAFQAIFKIDPVELESMASHGDTPPLRSEGDPVLFFAFGTETEIARRLRKWMEKIIRLNVSVRWRAAECQDITFTHQSLEDGDMFFFANNSSEPREVQLSIRCEGAPHLLDPETGETSALANCTQRAGRTMLFHRFERRGSLLIYFGTEPALRVRKQTSGLDGIELETLHGWNRLQDTGDRCAVSRADVEIPTVSRGQSVVLRAEEPAGVVEFAVNRMRAGVRAWAPYEVDITNLVQPLAGNIIEIKDVKVSEEPNGHFASSGRVTIC